MIYFCNDRNAGGYDNEGRVVTRGEKFSAGNRPRRHSFQDGENLAIDEKDNPECLTRLVKLPESRFPS